MKSLPIILIVLCSFGVVALILYYIKSTGLEKVKIMDPITGETKLIETKPYTGVIPGTGKG